MFPFCAKTAAKAALVCAALLTARTSLQAQARPASAQPVVVGAVSAAKPALVTYQLRQPDGRMTTIKLRRLPASSVVREAPVSALPPVAATQAKMRDKAFAPPVSLSPKPAVVSLAELYNTNLDYSHDNTPDFGWIFPTRGYDRRNTPGGFRLSLNSLIYPALSYVGTGDRLPHNYDNFGAPIELIQLGHDAQISSIRVSMGVAREIPGVGATPAINYNPAGGVAVILFWDGVYNDAQDGFPRDNQGAYKLAQDGMGASGVLVQLGQGFSEYVINFDNDAPAGTTKGRFGITDAQGRMGMTIAAVYDPNAGSVNGDLLSSPQDGVYLRPGAMVGQNKYFLISHGNLNIGTPSYDGNGVATTQNTFDFKPGDSKGDIFGDNTTLNLDGSVAYQVAPADMRFNPGEGIVPPGQTKAVASYAPLNSSVVLYGTDYNGGHAARGELRGRVRLLGVDPDSDASPTQVVSPYDPTPATPSLPKVPGESKMNRFRFTFITPAITASTPPVNTNILWSPETQLKGYTFFQQETYAMPSYGDNSDYAPGTTQRGTTLKYNYRLRGIPTGTYSLLVQAIPIVDIVPVAGGSPIVASSMSTPYSFYPGSDFAVYYVPSITIGESLFTPPNGTLSLLNYDYYTNTTTLDMKLRRPTDVTGGLNGTADGSVDATDFGILVGEYNNALAIAGLQSFDISGGLNGIPDGYVDATDFGLFVGTYNIGVVEKIGY